jgi:bacterioferritin B
MSLMPNNILDLLQKQYKHEMSNHLRYVARSSWARFRGLENTADYFDTEAKGELEHAALVARYIEDRNEAVEPSPFEFIEPLTITEYDELFTTALIIERDTTEKLTNIYTEAFKVGDIMTVNFMHQMIERQVAEENDYQTIIDRITSRGKDAAANHDIDTFIGELK